MLSASVDKWERGDESLTCSRLANYEQRFANVRPRTRREAKPDPKPLADPQLPAGTWVANGNRDESAFPDLNRNNFQSGVGGAGFPPDSRSPIDRDQWVLKNFCIPNFGDNNSMFLMARLHMPVGMSVD